MTPSQRLRESLATMTGQKAVRLTERVHSPEINIDREHGVIRNIKIIGHQSKNKRRYTESALRSAIGLYEGAQVNFNHAPDGKENDRPTIEQFGELRGVQERNDGLYGELHYLKTHPLTECTLERAERFPHSFGLSQSAQGRVVHRDGEDVVEEIEAVHSVDIVSRPASTAGLFESENPNPSEDEMDEKKLNESIAAESKRLREALEKDFDAKIEAKLTEATKPLTEKLAAAETKLAEAEQKLAAADKRDLAVQLLEAENIAPKPETVAKLLECADEAAMKAVIAAFDSSITHPRQTVPFIESQRQAGVDKFPETSKDFIAALR